MATFASILAGSECAPTIAAPSQNKATKVHARGPEITGICIRSTGVLWVKYNDMRLKKLMTSMSSAIQNRDRTHSRMNADCRTLLMMKWLPTLAAWFTQSAVLENRCQT